MGYPFMWDEGWCDCCKSRAFVCDCCREEYTNEHRDKVDGAHPTPAICRMCVGHQGDQLVLKLCFEHAAEYKKRLDGTRDLLGAATSERARLKSKLTQSERDREKLVAKLKEATDLHHFKHDRSCTCGLEKCSTVIVAEDPWTRERLGKTQKRKPAS